MYSELNFLWKGSLGVFTNNGPEAIPRASYKERDYDTILKAAERLPEAVLQEDQNLMMYIHDAVLRQQEKPRKMPLI